MIVHYSDSIASSSYSKQQQQTAVDCSWTGNSKLEDEEPCSKCLMIIFALGVARSIDPSMFYTSLHFDIGCRAAVLFAAAPGSKRDSHRVA